ncbi:MAG TPA: PQQ-binding-like beta-propeller repeat protein [Bryobacteraceae bacterium]|nr:PQQ-binding-like beta-propeller repeat protein [Bryobacteraceae bacterium]
MAHLFIGIKGTVLAIDRATGAMVWERKLGGDFINVVLDGDELYAAAEGELSRLDPATGEVVWNNGLKGKGFGLVTIAQSPTGNWNSVEEKLRRDEAAATGVTTA